MDSITCGTLDVGSIPIARSINLVDSVALTPGNQPKSPFKWSILFQRCSKTFLLVQAGKADRLGY